MHMQRSPPQLVLSSQQVCRASAWLNISSHWKNFWLADSRGRWSLDTLVDPQPVTSTTSSGSSL